jgi:hypothetical protein
MSNPFHTLFRVISAPYLTGDEVPTSGIYDVVNDVAHRKQNQVVTCIEGETFPACAGCKIAVQFRLRQPAKHLSETGSFH